MGVVLLVQWGFVGMKVNVGVGFGVAWGLVGG